MKDYEKEIIEILIEKLEEYEGCTTQGNELPFLLLENENNNCTITYSTEKAKNWIVKNFYDFYDLDLTEYVNPFAEPERFQVQLYIDFSFSVLSECEFVSQNWDNYITLDKDTIAIIKKELQEQLKDEKNL